MDDIMDDEELLARRIAAEADAARARGEFRREFVDQGFVGQGSGDVYEGARGAGFSQQGSNILARTMTGDVSRPTARYNEGQPGLDVGRFDADKGRATANVLAQSAAAEPDRNFEQAMLAQRRMDELKGRVVQPGLTREEATRRFVQRQGREDANMNLERNRALRFRVEDMQQRGMTDRATMAGAAQQAVAATTARGQADVARIGADVDLQRLAQEGRLAEALMGEAGFRTGPGGEAVYQDPKGGATAMPGRPGQARITLNPDGTRTVIQPDGSARVFPGPRAGQSEDDWLRALNEEAGEDDIPTVSSAADFDRLPSGARFRDPNGTIRRKP